MHNNLYSAGLIGLLAAGSLYAAVTPQIPDAGESQTVSLPVSPVQDDITTDSIVADTVPVLSEAERLADEATALYKEVKYMQYEGETESILYEAVYKTNDRAVAALILADTPELRQRSRNIIFDLNPLLLKGAFFASGQGDQASLARFARAYIDAQTMGETEDMDFKRDPAVFPTVVYNAAYGATQAGDAEAAQRYFQLYLDTKDDKMREQIFTYLAQSLMLARDYDRTIYVVEEAVGEYPRNSVLVNTGVQACLDGSRYDRIQPLLDRAIMLSPTDEKLQNVQARVYERYGKYKEALDIYRAIAEAHPNSMENTRRIGTCLYNLGAFYYNESIMENDEKAAGRARRQSKVYFTEAAKTLEEIVANAPADTGMLRALGQTYASLGERKEFDDINTRLLALGERGLTFNDMPTMMGDTVVPEPSSGASSTPGAVPSYEEFARPYIEQRLGTWAKRGEFEKMDDYRKRIAGGEGLTAYNALNEEAAEEYLRQYARRLTLTDLKRSDYDIDHETYAISTPYGETVVKVPLKNKEAEAFKAGWETAQIRAPRFIIRNGEVALAEITYVVNGRKYTYKSNDAAAYKTPTVYVDINGILEAALNADAKTPATGTSTTLAEGVWTESDVDRDIPVTSRKSDNMLALIVANEKYSKASDVFGAMHDGATMREYCVKTLGIPEGNVVLLNNATGNQFIDALDQLARRVKGLGKDTEVIFYYAGHGLPDDATKEAFLLPVDANPLNMATLTPMKDIYRKLGDMDAASVSVFLDACFSGEGREGRPVNESRGVALRARPVAPSGNMFVLSAASAQETAMPYKEKHHGLFTYFLLKKLQESKGHATLKQISDYVIKNVRDTSNSNPAIGKEQNPTVNVSGTLSTEWETKKLKSK